MLIKTIELKKISNPKGDIFKMLSSKNKLFSGFGEIYFSEVFPSKFKGWKLHKNMSQVMTVILGKVRFFIKYKKTKKIRKIDIGFPNNLKVIKIPKNCEYSFKCVGKTRAIIVNCTDKIYKKT
jgi:dTDP-4-dehydrorhamnose 3,5-epimerase